MTLKRKRSDSELSSSTSSSSLFSSPPRPDCDAFTFSFPSPVVRPFALSRASTPSHLHSRTLKRFRDNRPSEEEVHQHTLQLLYGAQQQRHPQEQSHHIGESEPAISSTNTAAAQCAPRQRSLHCFWKLPSAPISSTATPSIDQMSSTPSPTDCEDCGASFGASEAGADAMDVDGSETDGSHACGACGKHVCFSCSVSNLGEETRCLQCAGRKVGAVGTGWTQVGLSVY